jgi:hypothetical protein
MSELCDSLQVVTLIMSSIAAESDEWGCTMRLSSGSANNPFACACVSFCAGLGTHVVRNKLFPVMQLLDFNLPLV